MIIDNAGITTSGIKSSHLIRPVSFTRRIILVIIKNNSLVSKIEVIRIPLNWLSKKVTSLSDNFAIKRVVKVAIIATSPIVNADTNIFWSSGPRNKTQQNMMLISICNELA